MLGVCRAFSLYDLTVWPTRILIARVRFGGHSSRAEYLPHFARLFRFVICDLVPRYNDLFLLRNFGASACGGRVLSGSAFAAVLIGRWRPFSPPCASASRPLAVAALRSAMFFGIFGGPSPHFCQ
jgi:hypothetical protein